MAYVHVAHDCHVADDTIFGNMATLGGHVTVEDYVNISAGSGVHQFCRVGRHAFIGGYSVVTKDALPFARTVGSRPARIYGANTIGLVRRGFPPDVVAKLKRSFRLTLQSKLNTTRTLQQIEDRIGRSRAPKCSTKGLHPHVAARRSSCAARRQAEEVAANGAARALLVFHGDTWHEDGGFVAAVVFVASCLRDEPR
jgi:carbonic anhydrase/acetyltransferase-like protein (isoleucine patch superfamily)